MNRAEELIADLEAEIVKRDARIESVERENSALKKLLDRAHERMDELKEQQRGGVVLPERDVPAFHAEESPNWHGCIGWNAAIDEVARLNPPGDGVNWKAVAGEQKTIIEGLQARLNPPGECVAVSRDTLETALDNLLSILSDDEPLIEELRAILAQQGKAVGDE